MTWFRNLLLLVVFTASTALVAQEKQPTSPLTLSEAIAQQEKKARALFDALPALIDKIEKEGKPNNDSEAVTSFLEHYKLLQTTELAQQRLLSLQQMLGKKGIAKKTTQGWFDQVEKLTARLPKRPPLALPDFTAIDEYVRATPAAVETSVQKLGVYLGKGAKTDWEKARAVYVWVTDHMACDYDSQRRGQFETRVERLLTDRRAVCSGFAILYQTLAQYAGLQVWYLSGHISSATTIDYIHPEIYRTPFGITQNPHAYNVVKIGSKYFFIDSAWGAALKNFDYFLMPPETAIATYLPKDERWQLLKTPVKRTERDTWPVVYPSYFNLNCQLESHPFPVAVTRDQLVLVVAAPPDVVLHGSVRSTGKDKQLWHAFSQRVGNHIFFRTGFPEAGNYSFTVVAQRTADKTKLPLVMEYLVQAREPAPQPPIQFDRFPKDGYLYYPLSGKLTAGQTQAFAVAIPNATSAYLQVNNNKIFLHQRGRLFVGQTKLEPGTVRLFAQFPNEKLFQTVLEYTVP